MYPVYSVTYVPGPYTFAEGFVFHGFVHSKKQNLTLRRFKLKADHSAYQVRPSFVMPYMVGRTDALEKALFLRRWGVPFEAQSYVFGRDAMYFYRAFLSLGRPLLVGTSVKTALPRHVIADEKHTRLWGERVYVATTVSGPCLLGSEVVEQATESALRDGYGVFAAEVKAFDARYHPETVTTDGWAPTQKAWRGLFPLVAIVSCFLHGVLAVKVRCRRDKALAYLVLDRLWRLYEAVSLASFAQRLRRLHEWTQRTEMKAAVKEKVLSICAKEASLKQGYQHEGAYRTTNALERLMNYQDRLLYTMQYFHGTFSSASKYVRAMALLWNFHPYGARTRQANRGSPFEEMNGFRYCDNWLENLLVAASLEGQRQ